MHAVAALAPGSGLRSPPPAQLWGCPAPAFIVAKPSGDSRLRLPLHPIFQPTPPLLRAA